MGWGVGVYDRVENREANEAREVAIVQGSVEPTKRHRYAK